MRPPKHGVYLLLKSSGFYVGQTKDFFNRYPKRVRKELQAFVDVPYGDDLCGIEQAGIDFCLAMGIPLCNKVKRIPTRKPHAQI